MGTPSVGAPPVGGPNATAGLTPGAPTAGVPTAGAPGEVSATNAAGEELVRLNVQDADIRDIIKQISLATARNFILDDNVKGKITIISPKPMTKDEAYQTFLSALAVTGFTTVKGPAGVIKIVRLKDSVQYPIPTHVDSTPYTDSYVTRLIQLSNIGAVDMMNAIKALVSKDGNIYAYPSTNTLIITDSGTNIDRLMKIIKELDQEGPQQVLEIIPVRNALARDVSQTLTTLFKQEKQKAAPKPGELEELDEVTNILADERTNSIIVLASKRAIEKVRGIIARLDSRVASGQEGKIHVYYLKYAKAKQLSETLAALTSGAGQKSTAAPGAGGGAPKIAEFEGGIKIGADEPTNALIVTASAKDFQTLIERVIAKLDVPRRQVYIETVVMELSLNKRRDLGVSAGGGAGGKGMIGFGQSFGATSNFATSILGAPSLLGGLISSRTTNLNLLDSAGNTKTVSVPAFTAFLTAIQTYGDANVISTPNILTVENEESIIEVKQDKPIPSLTPLSATSAVSSASYTSKEVGLTLKVKPQISSNNSILLNVDEELSNFGPDVTFPGGYNIPTSKKRHIKTATVVGDGQTVVLGGLMEDTIRNTQEKVPLLGDIPILGFLFKKTGKQIEKNNLLIFLTPHVMDDATDFSRILQAKIDQRNKFMEQNYGKKQRDIIKNTIRNHREDLLEFKEASDLLPDTTFKATAGQTADPFPAVQAPTASPASTPKTKKAVPAPMPVEQPPSGVITVPSLSPGATRTNTYVPSPASSAAPASKTTRAPAMPQQQTTPAANPLPSSQPVKELNLTY
jgi:general secretion pathway protein D